MLPNSSEIWHNANIWERQLETKMTLHNKFSNSRDSAGGRASGCAESSEGSEFDYQYTQNFSSLHVVQTGFGARPASY
jgi:hypothetical protein